MILILLFSVLLDRELNNNATLFSLPRKLTDRLKNNHYGYRSHFSNPGSAVLHATQGV